MNIAAYLALLMALYFMPDLTTHMHKLKSHGRILWDMWLNVPPSLLFLMAWTCQARARICKLPSFPMVGGHSVRCLKLLLQIFVFLHFGNACWMPCLPQPCFQQRTVPL